MTHVTCAQPQPASVADLLADGDRAGAHAADRVFACAHDPVGEQGRVHGRRASARRTSGTVRAPRTVTKAQGRQRHGPRLRDTTCSPGSRNGRRTVQRRRVPGGYACGAVQAWSWPGHPGIAPRLCGLPHAGACPGIGTPGPAPPAGPLPDEAHRDRVLARDSGAPPVVDGLMAVEAGHPAEAPPHSPQLQALTADHPPKGGGWSVRMPVQKDTSTGARAGA